MSSHTHRPRRLRNILLVFDQRQSIIKQHSTAVGAAIVAAIAPASPRFQAVHPENMVAGGDYGRVGVAEWLLTNRIFDFAEGVEEGVDTVWWWQAGGLSIHPEQRGECSEYVFV
jgi:hypothetical protein